MEEDHQIFYALYLFCVYCTFSWVIGFKRHVEHLPLRFEWTCSTYSSCYTRGRTAHEKANFQGRRFCIYGRNFISIFLSLSLSFQPFLNLNYSKTFSWSKIRFRVTTFKFFCSLQVEYTNHVYKDEMWTNFFLFFSLF